MKDQLKIGSLLSYAQMALGIIIGIVYTPIMIRLLGQSEYGLYQTVSSTISMLGILNLGFNGSYIRYFAKYKVKDDKESIYKLNGLFVIIFSVFAVVGLACGLFLTNNLDLVFKDGLTDSEYSTAKVLMLLATLNLSFSFPFSVFTSIISANERFVFLKLVNMLQTVITPAITLPLLLCGYRSIAMIAVALLLAIIHGIINIFYVVVKLKNKFIFYGFEKGLLKSMFVYTSFIAINLIVDQINWNIDKMLLGRYKGTTAVAIYSVGYALYSYYMTFSTAISGVFSPRIHTLINKTKENLNEQRKQVTDLFIKVGRIQYLILALLASGIFFFGREFIVLIWAGSDYNDSYYVALLLIIPSTIALIQNLGIEIQRALNKHHFRSIVYLGMALVNLITSIILCQLYGAIGSALGTGISLILANGFVMNIYYHKKCNLDIIKFWKSIINLSKGLIIPIALGIAAKLIFEINSVAVLLICIFVYALVYCVSMWLFGMNSEEKDLVFSMLKRNRRNING